MKDKIVLITGGSQGFGKAAAKLFSEAGAKTVIAARNEKTLEAAAKETGCDGFISMDVTNVSDWQGAYDEIVKKYGRLDVLINNAGGGVAIESILDQTTEDISKSIDLNLKSAIYGAHTFAPLMKKQMSGTIINVASACAKHAWPGWSVYAAAKWGVLGFSKNLYVDLRPFHIRVTCLVPGAGATDFMQHAGSAGGSMKLRPEDVARTMLDVCNMPKHVVVEEVIVWGEDQVLIPL